MGPFFSLSAANDYACLLSFEPLGVSTTNMTLIWLVDRDAREGEDLDLERMCWMWDVTTRQDQVLIENNQRGMASMRYAPGPYSLLEGFTRQFVDWYLRQME
ncbi:MAG TPA: SRPBCC family protein [Acidobacteriota bacterium]|nr:SRPBCC family protein [Acidobacteriota bacterium]